MVRKAPPRHIKPTARQLRRAAPRHAIEPDVPLGAVTTLAVTIAGAVAVASSAYGYSPAASQRPGAPASAESQQASAQASAAQRREALLRGGSLNSIPGGAGSPGSDAATVSASEADRLKAEQAAAPAFVSIPSIHTTSSLIKLGLDTDGGLEVPTDYLQAGWYDRGPRPGDPGPAVLAGHLDSKIGPGIFSRLSEVKPGDIVNVTRGDGQVVQFAVTRVDQYPKRAFPTRQVYGSTDQAELRVITCGGSFDRSKGSYRDNIVVFARLVSPGASA
jgi:sortase (surface protein transpeptidase)